MEGLNDVEFLSRLSRLLAEADPRIPNLSALARSGNVIFIPFGGGSPRAFTHRLRPLGCREWHLYDREQPPESADRYRAASDVNRRLHCRAHVTVRRTLENYIPPEAIIEADGSACFTCGPEDCVGTLVALRWYQAASHRPWDSLTDRRRKKLVQKAKRWLNTTAVEHITPGRLQEWDPAGEVIGWLGDIASLLSPSLEAPPVGRSTPAAVSPFISSIPGDLCDLN